jgi:hypothetical protein
LRACLPLCAQVFEVPIEMRSTIKSAELRVLFEMCDRASTGKIALADIKVRARSGHADAAARSRLLRCAPEMRPWPSARAAKLTRSRALARTRRSRVLITPSRAPSSQSSRPQTAVQQLSREGRIAKDGSIISEAEAKEFAAANENSSIISAPSLKAIK